MMIIDFVMPGMNGAETMEQSRLIAPDLQVTMTSGFDPSHIAAELKDGAEVNFLQKPFEIAELLEIVEKAGLFERAGSPNGSREPTD